MHLNDIVLSDDDLVRLLNLSESNQQSICFQADRGFGKKTIAYTWALKKAHNRKENVLVVEAISSSITIDQIRSLKAFFALKSLDKNDERVAIIVDADLMTVEAQNSLLKILEEPQLQCTILLTVSHPEFILPTVSSRLTNYILKPIPKQKILVYLTQKGYQLPEIEKAFSMSGGLMGLTVDILSNQANSYVEQVQLAKDLLSKNIYERLAIVESISKDRVKALELIDATKLICNIALQSSKNSGKWANILRASLEAQKYLQANVSTKLTLTNFLLNA